MALFRETKASARKMSGTEAFVRLISLLPASTALNTVDRHINILEPLFPKWASISIMKIGDIYTADFITK